MNEITKKVEKQARTRAITVGSNCVDIELQSKSTNHISINFSQIKNLTEFVRFGRGTKKC